MTGSLETLSPIFFDSFYVCLLVINLVLCCAINGVIDYFVNKDHGPWHVVSSSNIFNMLVFAFILSVLTFFGSGTIHKRIKEGKSPTVTRRALCDTCFKKVICFSMQEPNWKKRFCLFIWNCLLFPGVFLGVFVSLMCMFATGFKSLGQADACEVSEAANIVVIESWKAVGMFIVFTMNFASSHNEEQPEVAEVVNPLLANPNIGQDADHGIYGDQV